MNKAYIIFFLIFGLLGIEQNAFSATADIQITTIAGTQNLNFSAVSSAEDASVQEASMSMSTDTNEAYQVTQALNQALTNTASGQTIPSSAFTIYTSGGSTNGILGARNPLEVRTEPVILFTSNSNGDPDAINLKYTISGVSKLKAGTYRSTISYVLRPLSTTSLLQTKTITLNVSIEIKSKLSMTITSADGSRELKLMPRSEASNIPNAQSVQINIDSNVGTQYRLTQRLLQPPMDSKGNTIAPDNIAVLANNSPSALSSQPTLILASDSNGSPASVDVSYSVNKLESQPAGNYTGQILYSLESADGQIYAETKDLRIPLTATFNLSISTPEGVPNLDFGHVLPNNNGPNKDVILTITSNLAARYQLTQTLNQYLTSTQGFVIPQGPWTFYMADRGATGGTTPVSSALPVASGTQLIFTSNNRGDSDRVVARYGLFIPYNCPSGTYTTRITYTLSTI